MVTVFMTLFSVVASFLILLDKTSAFPLIFQGPAPPPDEGPPLSASAVRDPSLLWRDVAGIVGGYVASVCILLGSLITIGRRLRRGVEAANRILDIEFKPSVQCAEQQQQNQEKQQQQQKLQKQQPPPQNQTMDEQPNGKPKGRRHRSLSMPWSNSNSRGPASPSSRNDSVSTVDENVVKADRQKAQEEMERLYAAVMEHDAQRSSTVASPTDRENCSPTSTNAPKSAPMGGFPEFQHLRQHRQQPISPVSAKSPGSPVSPRQIPEERFPSPLRSQFQQSPYYHHTSQSHPQPHTSQTEPPTPDRTPKSPISDRLSRISAFSFLNSKKSRDSVSSPKKSQRGSLRSLPISPPILSPQAQIQPTPAENQPLSPRIYHPGPPPPNPQQRYTGVSPTQARRPSDSQQQHQPPPLPSATASPANAERRTGSVGAGTTSAAGTSNSSLPFRAAFSPPQSPGTKTTVVEWRQSQLGRSAPRTGVPKTPYSPYMPFTPVTPITPSRVVTRDQRKMKEKQAGLRVMTEEDMVASDEDMWGA